MVLFKENIRETIYREGEGYHIVNRVSAGWKWREMAVEGYMISSK